MKGDVGTALKRADVIVEGEYRTGHQEQLYIEPNGVIAVPENGGVAVYGSLQCPFYMHKALRIALGLPDDRIRVIQTETGGGFGGKEEYPSVIAAHAALLALKAKRPVKLVYDRLEDMLATTKRHPLIVRHRTGVMRDGRLVAMDIDVLMDGGAYVTLSPVVLSRGAIHAAGPYRCDNVRIEARAVATNTPPNGAFRGFGAPQTQFAVEVHMERIAEALGLDPVRLREVNALRPGDTTATGQRVEADCSALQVLQQAVERSDFHAKRERYAGTNRGIGLSLFFHGAGFTGSGEVKLASRAALVHHRARRPHSRGKRRDRPGHAHDARADRGRFARQSRTRTSRPALPDTSNVPDSGPTVASRTCMVVGGILERCATELRERSAHMHAGRVLSQSTAQRSVTKQYEPPHGIKWDDETYRGDAYATYAWACDVAEVEMDLDTYEIRPTHFTAVQDIRQGDSPGARRRTDRGRDRAGNRLRAARGSRHARRRDGQRADHELHRSDDARHAPHGHRHCRDAEPSRAVRRQGRRRDADRRTRAGHRQRASAISVSTSGRSRPHPSVSRRRHASSRERARDGRRRAAHGAAARRASRSSASSRERRKGAARASAARAPCSSTASRCAPASCRSRTPRRRNHHHRRARRRSSASAGVRRTMVRRHAGSARRG